MDHIKFNPTNQSQPPQKLCNSDWLAGRISLIFSAYRRDEWQDPEGFIVQLGLNLEKFPQEVVEYVTDPVTGIQTRSKWPPSLAEVVEACWAELEHRQKVAKYSSMAQPAPRLPKPRYRSEDSYEAMTAKYGRPIGVFENVNDKWNARRRATK